jgi:hypothetical protein
MRWGDRVGLCCRAAGGLLPVCRQLGSSGKDLSYGIGFSSLIDLFREAHF